MSPASESVSSVGWVNVDRNDPSLLALRDTLLRENGIRGLEILNPADIDEAVRLFYRDGFVVIANALTDEQLDFVRKGCEREITNLLSLDEARIGNRGSHRYSFGAASLTGHQLHLAEWQLLLDLPTVTPILTAIFGSPDYMARGGGGDFCLPGAVAYQPLHSDMGDRSRLGGSFHDPRGRLTYRDLPCPFVCCNFLMQDFTALNGPTRQIPGTQHAHESIPNLQDEPEWMKHSTVCPAPAGSVLIRDVRAWHGGTPNLSDEVRAIPNIELYAPWFREPLDRSISRTDYQQLSDHAQRLCRYIVEDGDEPLVTGYGESVGNTPRRLRDEAFSANPKRRP